MRSTLAGIVAALAFALPAFAAPEASLVLHADQPGARIEPEIQGQFTEHLGRGIYEGVWVGEGSSIPNTRGFRNDVIAALKRIHVPVVRWPGGCFADTYNWRDGVGPRQTRPVRVNNSWGGVEEPNGFGTHEFFEFAELIGAKTYVSGNLGTGTAREMADWIEYLTTPTHSALGEERRRNGRAAPFKLDYFGIGNESWGCGGSMRPQYYADLFRQAATFVRPGSGPQLRKVAVGPSADDYAWTEAVMAEAGEQMDALSLHYYTLPTGDWAHKGAATGFDESQWIGALTQTLRMEELIVRHTAIMDRYDPKKRVALAVDEWGAWYDTEPGANPGFLYQQNTMRDAVLAAVNLNIFQRHADRVRMANIAQMANVLQAMVLTDRERMVLTPTYHVYDLYQVFQGATALPLEVEAPTYTLGGISVSAVHASAGRGADGVIHLGLVNLVPNAATEVRVKLVGVRAGTVSGRVLTAPAMDARNTFDAPDAVHPVPLAGARLRGDTLVLVLPARSVTVVDLK